MPVPKRPFTQALPTRGSHSRENVAIYVVGLPLDDDYVKDVQATSAAGRKLGLHVKIFELRPEAACPSSLALLPVLVQELWG